MHINWFLNFGHAVLCLNVAPNLSVVSESHVAPSAFNVGAEQFRFTASNVPAATSQSFNPESTGHPWHVPELQTSFAVCVLPSSHLRRFAKVCQG